MLVRAAQICERTPQDLPLGFWWGLTLKLTGTLRRAGFGLGF